MVHACGTMVAPDAVAVGLGAINLHVMATATGIMRSTRSRFPGTVRTAQTARFSQTKIAKTRWDSLSILYARNVSTTMLRGP